MTNLIALAGSLRKDSFNKALVSVAAKSADKLGAKVTEIDLVDYDIPLFSEDLEAMGTPSGVLELKRIFAGAHGVLIASPEYNGSISGVLKNALDWLSRPEKSEDLAPAFQNKVAGIMATSPGGLGGLRGLNHL